MAKAIMRKVVRGAAIGLVPSDDEGRDALAKVKDGAEVMCEFRRPRNLGHHKKLFKLLSIVVENQDHYKTPEHLLAALKVATGHCDEYPIKNGAGLIMVVPHSISFESMDQTLFEPFFNAAMDVVCSQIIPGMNKADLEAEIHEALNPSYHR